MKHNFEERRQNRIDHAKDQAAKNEKKSDDLYKQAQKMASAIPLGQPILVGHHSEKRDRNYRDKIHNTYGKAFAASDKAEYYEGKAESIESNDAIFSDDPKALEKLKDKLSGLQSSQEFMKAANKCIKKKDRESFLKLPFATEALWEQISKPDRWNQVGFASYSLRNNNTNIARLKSRIAELEKVATLQTDEFTFHGVRIVQNVEANRLQLFFPERLSKEHYKTVRQGGFVWCRSEQAFQRQLSPRAFSSAKYLLRTLYKDQQP